MSTPTSADLIDSVDQASMSAAQLGLRSKAEAVALLTEELRMAVREVDALQREARGDEQTCATHAPYALINRAHRNR